MHIYRWDLDKTYLETDFDGFRALMRTATEPAHAKKAVPGARALMRGLGQRDGARVVILSGSPTQMRVVLEEKLRLDGISYTDFVLKDNLDNLKRGRLRAIRGQFGYKLPMMLASRVDLPAEVTETCFGDDAEVDALVYSVYADVVAGRLGPAELSRILEAAGAYPDNIEMAMSALPGIATANAVDRVFIRLSRNAPPTEFDSLGQRVVPIHSWWQAALALVALGKLDMDVADDVLAEVVAAGLDGFAVAGLAQDIVARGHVPAALLLDWKGPIRVGPRVHAAIGRLAQTEPARSWPRPTGADYLKLVRAWVK